MGLTDGSFVCALCGEWRTACGLCGEAPLLNARERRRQEVAADRDADAELRAQERAIRRAAEERRLT